MESLLAGNALKFAATLLAFAFCGAASTGLAVAIASQFGLRAHRLAVYAAVATTSLICAVLTISVLTTTLAASVGGAG